MNGWVISSYTLLDMWVIFHAVITGSHLPFVCNNYLILQLTCVIHPWDSIPKRLSCYITLGCHSNGIVFSPIAEIKYYSLSVQWRFVFWYDIWISNVCGHLKILITNILRWLPLVQNTIWEWRYLHDMCCVNRLKLLWQWWWSWYAILHCQTTFYHCSDVIRSAMAPQISGVTIVHSTVCSGADQRKHQSSASLAFVIGIHRWPVNSPYKGPVTRKMFPSDDVIIIAWIQPIFAYRISDRITNIHLL